MGLTRPRTIHEGLVPGENCPDTDAILAVWQQQVTRNTATLASLRDEIILLHDRYGLSFREIGQRLGMSRGWASKVYRYGGDREAAA